MFIFKINLMMLIMQEILCLSSWILYFPWVIDSFFIVSLLLNILPYAIKREATRLKTSPIIKINFPSISSQDYQYKNTMFYFMKITYTNKWINMYHSNLKFNWIKEYKSINFSLIIFYNFEFILKGTFFMV